MSADYLLGILDEPIATPDDIGVHNLTGLSTKAAKVLEQLHKTGRSEQMLETISLLIEQECPIQPNDFPDEMSLWDAIAKASMVSALTTINALLRTKKTGKRSFCTTEGDIGHRISDIPTDGAALTAGFSNYEIIEAVLMERLLDQLHVLKGDVDHGEHS